MAGAEAFGNRLRILVGRAGEPNGKRREHW
jgi:hypothetical protein